MRLTAKQGQALLIILQDSLKSPIIAGQFTISSEQRANLLDRIINQQSDELTELIDLGELPVSMVDEMIHQRLADLNELPEQDE